MKQFWTENVHSYQTVRIILISTIVLSVDRAALYMWSNCVNFSGFRDWDKSTGGNTWVRIDKIGICL